MPYSGSDGESVEDGPVSYEPTKDSEVLGVGYLS